MLLHSLLMQEPKRPPKRKRWYGRVVEVIILWKSLIKSPSPPQPPPPAAAAAAAKLNGPIPGNSGKAQKLRKCASLKVASSFTRVCLCAPISSYNNEVFRADAPPRRSYSYPRSRSSLAAAPATGPPGKTVVMRSSVEARRVFRGKSLTDDILMRRFVVAEEAMLQQLRRRNQMEFIRRRNAGRRRKIGPSPLSRMAMAEEEEEDDDGH